MCAVTLHNASIILPKVINKKVSIELRDICEESKNFEDVPREKANEHQCSGTEDIIFMPRIVQFFLTSAFYKGKPFVDPSRRPTHQQKSYI